MPFLSFITSRVAGPLNMVFFAIALMFAISQCSAKVSAEREVKRLNAEIHAPVTGWEARLNTCHANVTTLADQVGAQNAKIDAARREGQAHAKMLSDALVGARKEAAANERKANTILAAKLQGADACAQLRDLDKLLNGGAP